MQATGKSLPSCVFARVEPAVSYDDAFMALEKARAYWMSVVMSKENPAGSIRFAYEATVESFPDAIFHK